MGMTPHAVAMKLSGFASDTFKPKIAAKHDHLQGHAQQVLRRSSIPPSELPVFRGGNLAVHACPGALYGAVITFTPPDFVLACFI